MAGTSSLRLDAEESVTVGELSRLTAAVAEELVERVIVPDVLIDGPHTGGNAPPQV